MRNGAKKSSAVSEWFSIALLVVVVSGVFAFTVRERRQWFGIMSEEGHHWLSAHTVLCARNWCREGPASLKFSLIMDPASVEFNDLESRDPNPSYGAGCVLPVYLAGVVLGREPDMRLLMGVNLAYHLLTALLLALTGFLFLRIVGCSSFWSAVFSMPSAVFVLVSPGPMYWMQNVFFADQAVVLPFAGFVFLEILRWRASEKWVEWISVLQALLMFLGILTDWLFVFVAFFVYVKRFVSGETGRSFWRFIPRSTVYWLPGLAAILVFTWQLNALGILGDIFQRFLFRTGLGAGGEQYVERFNYVFWMWHVSRAFGRACVYALWGSCVVLAAAWAVCAMARPFRRMCDPAREKAFLLALMVLGPCLVQTYVFRNHSWVHDFAALKYVVPLALVVPLLVPFMALRVIRVHGRDLWSTWFLGAAPEGRGWMRLCVRVAACAILYGVLLLYCVKEHEAFRGFFPEADDYSVAEMIGRHAVPGDMVFGYQYEIPVVPPQKLAVSLKRVYAVESATEIAEVVNGVPGVKRIWVVMDPATAPDDLAAIAEAGEIVDRAGSMSLYVIDGAVLADED